MQQFKSSSNMGLTYSIILELHTNMLNYNIRAKKKPSPNRIHNIYFFNLLHRKQLIEQ